MYIARIGIAAIVLHMLLASAGHAQTTPSPSCPTAVVPASVGGHQLVGWEKFTAETAGDAFRYRAAGTFTADVYIYPGRQGHSVAQEISDFKQTLELMRNRGDFDSFEVVADRPFSHDSVDGPGQFVTVALRRADRTQSSYLVVVPYGGKFLKVRITYPADRVSESNVDNFARELLGQLRSRR